MDEGVQREIEEEGDDDRSSRDAQLERCAKRRREKITITMRSGAAVWAMKKDVLPNYREQLGH